MESCHHDCEKGRQFLSACPHLYLRPQRPLGRGGDFDLNSLVLGNAIFAKETKNTTFATSITCAIPARNSQLFSSKNSTRRALPQPQLESRATHVRNWRACPPISAKPSRMLCQRYRGKPSWEAALNKTRNNLLSGRCICSDVFLRQSSGRAFLGRTLACVHCARTAGKHGSSLQFLAHRPHTHTRLSRSQVQDTKRSSYLNTRTFRTTPTSTSLVRGCKKSGPFALEGGATYGVVGPRMCRMVKGHVFMVLVKIFKGLMTMPIKPV